MNIFSNYEIVFQSPLVSDVENAPIYLLGEDHYNLEVKDLNARLINEKIEANSILLVETYPSLQLVPENLKNEYIKTHRIFDVNKSDLTLLGWDELSKDQRLIESSIRGVVGVKFLISSVQKMKEIIGQSLKLESVDLMGARVQEWREILRDFELQCNRVNEADAENLFNMSWDQFYRCIRSLSRSVNKLHKVLKTFDQSGDSHIFKMFRRVKRFKASVLKCLKKFCVNREKWKSSYDWIVERIIENMPIRTERMTETIEKIYNGQDASVFHSKIFLIAGGRHLKCSSNPDNPRFSLEEFYERMKSLPVVALIPKSIANC